MGGNMNNTYGALLIGVLFATFFQGILSAQAYVYLQTYSDDIIQLKLLVLGVWLLDAAHLVLISQSCYHYLVTSFGDATALLFSTPELDLHLIFVGSATLVCQGFFLHRIWTCSRRNWLLTGILSTACLAAFALEILISRQIMGNRSVAYFSQLQGEVVALFTVGAAADMAIAIVLFAEDMRTLTHCDVRTNSLVDKVVYFTVATGLATSVPHCRRHLLLFIFSQIIYKPQYLGAPKTFIFIAMHFSLGRLYTNALLATLNFRRSLRQTPHTLPSAPSVPRFQMFSSIDVGEYPMPTLGRSNKDLPAVPMPIVLPLTR
ncbi:hypothetical protein FB45DRAFT_1104703 [Roridomyces roridus]|uniref:DUF6534 domain-containing protein n=1 Tax=Roridomyces roridus TaxID=1738132 RepID=A0AAD7FDH6_9AGAR|nr:hypothetical protein FB45DRAFT_1104703 [Roridomyces roridus]